MSEVLTMYDVRGIQKYIFKTNATVEIIGASRIVENIITDGLRRIVENDEEYKKERENFILEWENPDQEIEFLKNENIKMQVLFIGGGNAYVLFRNEDICIKFNKGLGKFILNETYSLNLAVAFVKKTESYSKDYNDINLKMREIKSRMTETKPLGAMPVFKIDTATGYPLTKVVSGKRVSTESALKIKAFRPEDDEKVFDKMVTAKGDNSALAVVHIDGNSMGSRIKDIMENKRTYEEAIKTMRQISLNIKNGFAEAFSGMCSYIDELSPKVKSGASGKLYRKIVLAGDDITFVCNAKLALGAVEAFIKNTVTKVMYNEEGLSEAENRRKYAFSACAGIAFINSHFPFTDAYEVAEACCSSAKAEAKKAERRGGGKADGNIGCYVDYQVCSHIKAADISEYRKKNYTYTDGSSLLGRPYYIPYEEEWKIEDINERNEERSISKLFENVRFFNGSALNRSDSKQLRNAFSIGKEEVERNIIFLKSRKKDLPETDKKTWYDALEIMDICELKGEE